MNSPLNQRWKPRTLWGVIASATYLLGATVTFLFAGIALEQGTDSQGMLALLTTFFVIGIVLTGLGQLMRAAAHGSVSSSGKHTEGWGKIIGVAGWSIGLVSAVFFALERATVPEWVLYGVVSALFVPAILTLIFSLRNPR